MDITWCALIGTRHILAAYGQPWNEASLCCIQHSCLFYVHTIKYLLPLILVPLLPNFQVDALRTQVSSLESDLRATAAANSRLQDQLAESMRAHASQDQRSLEDMEVLKAQVCVVTFELYMPICVSLCLSVYESIYLSVWPMNLHCTFSHVCMYFTVCVSPTVL